MLMGNPHFKYLIDYLHLSPLAAFSLDVLTIGVCLRACEKIPPWLRAPLIASGHVAGPPVSGQLELAIFFSFGTLAPCQTHLGAPLLHAGIFSKLLSFS